MNNIEIWSQKLVDIKKQQIDSFFSDTNVNDALINYSNSVDKLIIIIYKYCNFNNHLSLIAVGGYGRKEMQPYSDIDLLILADKKYQQIYQQKIAKFIAILWDIGFEVGHNVCNHRQCSTNIEDVSIITNLLDKRLIIGDKKLFAKIYNDWSSQHFFLAKQKEKQQRHKKFSGSSYSLEPNIKESPGGLRDIDTIIWLIKFAKIEINKEFITDKEKQILITGKNFLNKVRFALHYIAKKNENRLLFDYQIKVAKLLNYYDNQSKAVEIFMHDYYKNISKILQNNDIIWQLLQNKIINFKTIDNDFIVSYNYITAKHLNIFNNKPSSMIAIFALIAKYNYIKGIEINTLRELRKNLNIIDQNYHKKYLNNKQFIYILQQKHGVNKALKLMHRYGVLERYIPDFSHITGLMQYDFFHSWTVDEHSLFVVRNLRRFFIKEYSNELPLCSEIATQIIKPELLILAGLFHDIGKGRGVSHSELGAKIAVKFCQTHKLTYTDTNVVKNLIAKHLLMSNFINTKDINDIDVIAKFANIVGNTELLKMLYLLTVADIRATKIELWNDWKDLLLRNLFYRTTKYLTANTAQPKNIKEQIINQQQEVKKAVIVRGYNANIIKKIITNLPSNYFVYFELNDIIWHFDSIVNNANKTVIKTKNNSNGITDLFVYSNDLNGMFYLLINALEKLSIDIVDAKIITTKDTKTYNTISFLTKNNNENIAHNVHKAINASIQQPKPPKINTKYISFEFNTKISFSKHAKWRLTKVNICTTDKKSLLSNIAYIFYKLNFKLTNAIISTLGSRVEDSFFISYNNNFLTKEQEDELKEKLKNILNN